MNTQEAVLQINNLYAEVIKNKTSPKLAADVLWNILENHAESYVKKQDIELTPPEDACGTCGLPGGIHKNNCRFINKF